VSDFSNKVQLVPDGEWQDRFVSLVTKHEQQVFSFVSSLVGDIALAERISRDAFIAIFYSHSGSEDREQFEILIYRRALALSRDQLLTSADKYAEMCHVSLSIERVMAESASCSDLLAAECHNRKHVNSLVSHLPFEYRAVFLLRDMRGFSFDEVSAIMSMNVGEVRQVLHRARLMLRRWSSKALTPERIDGRFDSKSFRACAGQGETDPATAH
jgi:RNA polymerase sigma-70 factor, ECF subfamily